MVSKRAIILYLMRNKRAVVYTIMFIITPWWLAATYFLTVYSGRKIVRLSTKINKILEKGDV